MRHSLDTRRVSRTRRSADSTWSAESESWEKHHGIDSSPGISSTIRLIVLQSFQQGTIYVCVLDLRVRTENSLADATSATVPADRADAKATAAARCCHVASRGAAFATQAARDVDLQAENRFIAEIVISEMRCNRMRTLAASSCHSRWLLVYRPLVAMDWLQINTVKRTSLPVATLQVTGPAGNRLEA